MARPLKLNETITKKLCEALAIGCTRKQAAQYAGISASTFYGWMDRATNRKEPEFLEFLDRIEKANAQRVISNLAVIRRAATEDKNWQAAAWLLERRDGFVRNPEANVEITIDASQVNVQRLLEDVKNTQTLVSTLLAEPVIDLDE